MTAPEGFEVAAEVDGSARPVLADGTSGDASRSPTAPAGMAGDPSLSLTPPAGMTGDPPHPLTAAQAWRVLEEVLDPEVPVLSVVELGIVRDLRADAGGWTVVLTPTYSGCPATEAIQVAIRDALLRAGAGAVRIEVRLAPAWSTDWIAPAAREKLRAYGIAPPHEAAAAADEARPIGFVERVDCPRCGSASTQRLSAFGATACKALYRCRACLEPFEYFKAL
jgi:ring-1,2-phenylacetyl-CoA epoxidase subunit PaaD